MGVGLVRLVFKSSLCFYTVVVWSPHFWLTVQLGPHHLQPALSENRAGSECGSHQKDPEDEATLPGPWEAVIPECMLVVAR